MSFSDSAFAFDSDLNFTGGSWVIAESVVELEKFRVFRITVSVLKLEEVILEDPGLAFIFPSVPSDLFTTANFSKSSKFWLVADVAGITPGKTFVSFVRIVLDSKLS